MDFGDNTVKELSADLVIDAGGLGTRTSKLLKEDGFGTTSEQIVINNVGYTSRIYSRDPRSDQDSLLILLFPQPPHQKTIGIATPIENGRWLVTIAGWFNQFPKQNADSFDDYMKNHLPSQEIYNKIKDCEPLSGVSMYKHPKSIWKRYDTLQNFPDGLLVVGASLCSINPFLGQGMTLSIMQTKTTDKFIAGWQKGKYPTKFIQKKFTKDVQDSWEMGELEDMRYTETKGKRTFLLKLKHRYTEDFVKLSATKDFARKIHLEIVHMLKPSYWAFHPKIVMLILRSYLKK